VRNSPEPVKKHLFLFFMLLAACGSPTEERSTETGGASDEERIETAYHQVASAIMSNDAKRIASHYTIDAVISPPGRPELVGRDDIQKDWQDSLDHFEMLEVGASPHEIVVFGDWAFVRGATVITARSRKDSQKAQNFIKFVEIWQRQTDGSWKIARSLSNT
jgi:uncharacterized protein (TIGR02246 family)